MATVNDKAKLQEMEQKLNQDFLHFQLFAKAIDLFQNDPPVYASLQKHLLQSFGAPILDRLHVYLAKELTGSVSLKTRAITESLEKEKLDTFMIALRDLLDESGLKLQNLDKEIEESLLQSYLKELTSEVSEETDVVKFLQKILTLLYIQVYKKALQVPEVAFAAAVSHLKDTLPDSTYKMLVDYQKATSILLALQAAAVDDEEEYEYSCNADRTLSQIEDLESMKPELKALVLGEAN